MPTIERPLKVISPSRGFNRPLRTRSTVDFPAPFGPTIQVVVPFSTSRSNPLSTSPPSYPAKMLCNLRIILLISQIGFKHRRIFPHSFGRPSGDFCSAMHHHHHVTKAHHKFHIVLDY